MDAGSVRGCAVPDLAVVIAGHAPAEQVRRCVDSIRVDSIRADPGAVAVVHAAGNPAPPATPGVTALDLGEHLGRPAAVNRAVAELPAEVEFVLVSEPGVIWDNGAVAALLAAARATPRAGALVPELRGATVPGLPGHWRGDALLTRLDPGALAPGAPGPAVLVRRTALESTGGWDARLPVPFADADLADRLDAAGWLRVAVPGAAAVRDAVGDIPESADERHAGARRLVRGRTRGVARAAAGAVLAARRAFGPRAPGPTV
ncbi:glycosyltransferase family 2 protein [Pseudonocardia sp. N23]|uniref:glycosyltransferase family 2 protein n=1 Tax=Pseudonocardia sp. N23 TaxID=1987376 RepID=UPI000BFC40AD|nr:hypothetical protein [Pseudonocardia sp. N23]GAY09979.1 dTDP-Rha:A-D-GlcNAc-diphosphoryl polyprenol, A-3-L-rhamnosyl transferase WbbL [Pseudonocardia sp. N23]